MGACETACCGQDNNNVDTGSHNLLSHDTQKPFSQANLYEISLPDERQHRKIEEMINNGAGTADLARFISPDPKQTLLLLSKQVKTQEEYQKLCIKDAELSFRAMDFGSLKYMGQVRMVPVYADKATNQERPGHFQQGSPDPQNDDQIVDYEYTKSGYGKMVWPDNSSFEGYWINGQAVGVGVFRAPEPQGAKYEGYWQRDRQTDLCVFRQNAGCDIQQDLEMLDAQSEVTSNQDKQNGKGIEVWSDGSYYHGIFKGGVKEGEGCYFWADGSKYTGSWSNDEMSGSGCFQWADGRYFQGFFQNGVMHGEGNYVWQDGRRYDGYYRFNKKHGFGTYTYSDGSKYRGEWVDGMQHGVGCIVDADSTYERKGVWAQGKLKRWLKAGDEDEEQ